MPRLEQEFEEPGLVEALRKRPSPETRMRLTLTIGVANFTNRVYEAMARELE